MAISTCASDDNLHATHATSPAKDWCRHPYPLVWGASLWGLRRAEGVS